MIFIAESGSTKCDAVFIDNKGNEVSRTALKGLNPQHLSADEIKEELAANTNITHLAPKVTTVHFYGAGCSSAAANAIVKEALKSQFNQATLYVSEDLLAVAHATSSDGAAICCILGTGSNCFYFDGNNAHKSIAGLGYILGDEGSAMDIGKQLVLDFLHQRLPPDIHQKFTTNYALDRDEIIRRVYRCPGANTFLAGFSTFVGENIASPHLRQLVKNCFINFTQLYIVPYKEATIVPLHFAGSVAFHYQEILREVLDEYQLKVGHIIQRPLDRLISYHQNIIRTDSLKPS